MAITGETIKAAYLKLPDYQKTLITVGVIVILGGLYGYFLYMPMLQEVETLESKLIEVQTKVRQVRAVAEELPKFEAQHREVEAKLKNALTQLPSSDEIPQLLKNMELLALDSEVSFVNLNMNKEKIHGFYAEVPVALKLNGAYHDTAVFFDKLSKLPRIINVSALDIGSAKEVEGKVLLNINCIATTYKFIDKK